MEAVQQKVSLSQQLEEMEVKMDIFLQEQVKDFLLSRLEEFREYLEVYFVLNFCDIRIMAVKIKYIQNLQ